MQRTPERGTGTRLRDVTAEAGMRARLTGVLCERSGSHPSASAWNLLLPSRSREAAKVGTLARSAGQQTPHLA